MGKYVFGVDVGGTTVKLGFGSCSLARRLSTFPREPPHWRHSLPLPLARGWGRLPALLILRLS